jgi:ABC-type cobalt transport system substrate-binding protein
MHSNQDVIRISHIAMRATYTAHLILFDLNTQIVFGGENETVELRIMALSPGSNPFIPPVAIRNNR